MHLRRLGLLLACALLGAACSTAEQQVRSPTRPAGKPACGPALEPTTSRAIQYPTTPDAPDPFPAGTSLDVMARAWQPPDTDGDGQPDTVGSTERLTLTRGDGVVTLERDDGVVTSLGGRLDLGDVDGDGREDLLVLSTQYEIRDDTVVAVPGSVATGVHDARDVGVRLPIDSAAAQSLVGVGDQDGDGADDVLTPVGVVSGRALLAPGAGGSLAAWPKPIREVDGQVVAVVALEGDAPPSLVVLDDQTTDGARFTILSSPLVRLRTAGAPFVGFAIPGAMTAYESGGHRIVRLSTGPDRGGTGGAWWWDLDAAGQPCTASG